MAKSQTVLQIIFIDGERKVIEYEGDDLVGITKLLDSESKKKEIAAVRIKTLGPEGKVIFDNGFSYVPEEVTGE